MFDHVFHYRILERIGEGGMGVVYRAHDTRLERDVALKFLSLDFTGSNSLKERFIQEAKAASALDHPNICTIHAIEETEDGRLFIAMGYYQGETVKAKLKHGSLPWQEIVDLAIQIAAGLQAAHKQKIIHLDIKPANLMVTPEGVVKILDFGLSRFTSEIDRTRPQGPLMGTVAYMSPELVQGEETGPESDVWALGVVMYEMATGKRPFQGKNDMAVLYAIVHKECPSLCEKAPDVPGDLEKVIRRALVKDRRHRYQNTAEVLADLEPMKVSRVLPPDSSSQKRLLRATGAVAAVILAVLILWLISNLFQEPALPEPTDVVLVGFANQSPEPETDWLGKAFAELVVFRLPDSENLHWIPSEEIVLGGGGSGLAAEPGVWAGNSAAEIERIFDPQSGFEPPVRRQLRQNRGIEWSLGGSFQVVEEGAETRFAVEVSLQDTRSGAIERLSESGPVAELPELAARVSDALVPYLDGAAPPLEPAAEMTEAPRDPEALRLLDESRERLRVREAQAALDDLGKAIAIERESPLLHLTLSEADEQLNLDREARTAAENAIEQARRLVWRKQIYYGAWRLELRGKLDRAAPVYRLWWALNDPGERSTDPLTLDRGVQVALVLAKTRQSAAALAVVERLRPLLDDDPRVALLEVESIRDERLEDEQAAAARAVELARQRGAPLLEARGLTLEGQAWQRLGEDDQAGERLEAARKIYSLHGYKGGEAGVLNILGNLKNGQGNYLGAKTSYEMAAQLYGEIGNQVLRARLLHNKALVHGDRGELGVAIEVLRQAMPHFVAEDVRDGQVTTLINLGDYQLARGQFADAEKSLDQAFEILDSWRNSRLTAVALTRKGHLRAQQGALLDARQILTQAIEAHERTKEQLETAFAKSMLADVLYHQGKLVEALQLEETALEGYGENGEIRADMGKILMAMGDLDRARENFAKALEIQRDSSNPGAMAQTRLYQAQLLFFGENEIEKSVATAREVLAAVGGNQDFLLVRAQAHNVLGRSLLAQGKAEEARSELASARALLADTGSPLYELPLEILEAQLMAFDGDAAGARDHLHAAIANAMTGEFALLELEMRLVLAEVELGSGSGVTGRNQLLDVVREARQKGYGLIEIMAERVAERFGIALPPR